MSAKAEKLQEAIGLIKDEYVEEAHAGEAAQTASQSGAQANAQEKTGPEPAAKVVKMPAQRKRRAGVPLAIAACLVIVLGAGALAFTSMSKPAAEDAAKTEAVETEAGDGKHADADAVAAASASATMAAEVAADGAADGAGSTAGYSNLVPGSPDFPRPAGEALVLTAGTWNDNDNWPFFMNLVKSDAIRFPVYGLDPVKRVKVTVVDNDGNPLRGESVTLLDEAGRELWHAESGKDGAAYLFFGDGQTPARAQSGSASVELSGKGVGVAIDYDEPKQGHELNYIDFDDATITLDKAPATAKDLQVMFIVDTTGSMSDEIAYLQKDFAAIAADAGNDRIEYSVNFYRDEGDEYVTKCNAFTSDVAQVQSLLNKEYADGGGDTPEAVAQILAETITDNDAWSSDCNKLAFLIFDAPPHDGTDAAIDAAVRSAAGRGIRLVPVVASNADRETELFGRALAIMTDGEYVFLTDDSGVGDSHLEPIVGDYTVELLHDVIVRIINDSR